jgi:uncharacterized membrane protein
MRTFVWTLLMSIISVLLIYLAGIWFDSLIPR